MCVSFSCIAKAKQQKRRFSYVEQYYEPFLWRHVKLATNGVLEDVCRLICDEIEIFYDSFYLKNMFSINMTSCTPTLNTHNILIFWTHPDPSQHDLGIPHFCKFYHRWEKGRTPLRRRPDHAEIAGQVVWVWFLELGKLFWEGNITFPSI